MKTRLFPIAIGALLLGACGDAPTGLPALIEPDAPAFSHVPGSPTFNPANGHYYQLVESNLSWSAAKAAAEASSYGGAQGHLATITSQSENDFVKSLVNHSTLDWVWIGGRQPDACQLPKDSGWEWVTGEAWSYTNWAGTEPNDFQGTCESLLIIHGAGGGGNFGKWTDLAASHSAYGTPLKPYVVEYTPSDSDGDGVPDSTDNCVSTNNPNQSDVDGDGLERRPRNDVGRHRGLGPVLQLHRSGDGPALRHDPGGWAQR